MNVLSCLQGKYQIFHWRWRAKYSKRRTVHYVCRLHKWQFFPRSPNFHQSCGPLCRLPTAREPTMDRRLLTHFNNKSNLSPHNLSLSMLCRNYKPSHNIKMRGIKQSSTYKKKNELLFEQFHEKKKKKEAWLIIFEQLATDSNPYWIWV